MIKTGTKVKLKTDVLQRHARSVPASMGYTTEQFAWRDTLRKLKGKVGEITRTFPDSQHVNVQFGKTLIGINKSELDEKSVKVSEHKRKGRKVRQHKRRKPKRKRR